MRRQITVAGIFVTAALLSLGVASEAQAAGEFVYPISGPLTSTYYSSRSYGNHAALDIAGANRGSVGAARGGRVSFRGWSGGYGNLVKVDHGSGYETYYAHLNAFRVSSGQQVSTGTTIGLEGTTGNSTGPHVHFEVRRWGAKQYLPGSRGNRVTKGRAIGQTYSGLSGSAGGGGGAPAPTNAGRAGWRITAGALNVRSGPSTGYAVVGSVRAGERVVSVAQSGSSSWRKIWYRGRSAWIHTGYAARQQTTGFEVTASALNVRTGPSTGYARSGSIARGQVYATTGSSGAWRKITWGQGSTRWCHGGYGRTFTAN